MKNYIILISIFFSTLSFSQDLNFGIEVSPAYKLQSIRNTSTGLLSSISGYGFELGVPAKIHLENEKSISTGILYEFSAFDNRINSFLVSSLRLNALQIPVYYNYPIIEGLYFNSGGGLNYIFSSKEYGGGIWINTNSLTNRLQPFLSAGLSTLMDRHTNTYELGVNARYSLIDIWKNNAQTNTKIIAIDLNLKYYF